MNIEFGIYTKDISAMTRRTQIRINMPTPILNKKEFEALTDLLYELLKGNQMGCARVLGINVRTWKKWEKEPPEWPWWNLVLRSVIIELLANMKEMGGITKHHRNRILEGLTRIKRSDTLIEEAERLSYEYRGAEAHLRRLLRDKGMFIDKIRLAGNSGGYTEKALRVAARRLGIVKTQEGYGENKRSYWRLPTEDDE